MSRFLRLAVLVVLAASILPIPLISQQAPPSADTFVSSATPNINYGSSIVVAVGPGTITFLKFNLSGVPTSATVSKATLRLYVDAVVSSGQMDVYNLPSGQPWSENTLKYNTPFPTVGASATGGNPVTVSAKSINTFLLIDITPTVQGWLTNPSTNNGVALTLIGNTGFFSFDSKESFLTAHQPELEIVLNGPAGVQGAQGLAGPAGPQGPQGAAGPQGAVGPAGPAGQTGAQGPAGMAGPQGPVGPMGAQGAQGAAGADGLGFTFRNAFDATLAYAPRDVVTYNGSSYVAIAASTGPNNSTPDTNTGAWSLIAQAGSPGVAGANGAAGPAGMPGIQGPMGPVGPQGPQGQAGIGGGLNGFGEYTSSGTLTVPAGVTHLLVELWGGGGGGGGGLYYNSGCNGPNHVGYGGGGGSGAYTRAVVTVTSGKTYTVNVGSAGMPGGYGVIDQTCSTSQAAQAGTAGGDSQLLDGATALISASGGQGGSQAIYPVATIFGGTDTGGAGGAGGVAASGAGLLGRAGTPGSRPIGGSALIESLTPIGTNGGSGGPAGSSIPPYNFVGAPGSPGYVLVTY